MPKKKQNIIQNNIPGRFIPRDDSPSTSVYRPGGNPNRFNSRMAELLASSTTVSYENESNRISQDEPISSETSVIDSSRFHSKLLHRRIVNMLETVKKKDDNDSSDLSTRISPNVELKSQPITFGQLRQGTTLAVSQSCETVINNHSESMSSASSRNQINKERIHYSPSLEQLLQSNNPIKHDQQQQPKSSITVEDILENYSTKLNLSPINDRTLPSQVLPYSNYNQSVYMHPTTALPWNPSLQMNSSNIPPPILVNEQNRNRPPPPSYSSSVTNSHQLSTTVNSFSQNLIRPIIPSSISEQVLLPNPTVNINNNSIRPPPPHYETTIVHTENLSQVNQHRPAGFDREFSRLLYGKDGGKHRTHRQKRKAFSDPVKKSVEEAGRSVEKGHRRLTTHLHKTHTVKEEEENSSDNSEFYSFEKNLPPQRRFQRQSDLDGKHHESVTKPIVPANPILKKRIPSFLRVYSQASTSNDMMLQWNLFSLSELVSFDPMMRKLYKDENLLRVQSYENYRALLRSTLASKLSSNKMSIRKFNNNDDDDAITTTAL